MSDLPLDQRQAQQYLGITTTAGGQQLQVVSVRGAEQLSTPFAYELDLIATDSALDWQSLIGTAAAVAINGTGLAPDTRYIHGLFAAFGLAGSWPGSKHTHFRATLVPRLALLDLARDCRIFQNLTVVAIVQQVLSAAGVTDVVMRVTNTYTARDYCVQWRETSLNFIRRLMEDEGLFFWFEHTATADTMVIADDADGHLTAAVVPSVGWSDIEGQDFQDDQVRECGLELRVVPDSVGLNAWNFETPTTVLYSKQQGTTAALTINDWGYTHADATTGATLAGIRLGAYEVEAKLLRIEGANRYFCCGFKFTLTGHPDATLNGSWVVLEHALEASPEAFHCNLRAFPAGTVFRAPRIAHRPTIASMQTAIVVGPSGAEINTDQYGRVNVQFHWDRLGKNDENSSCWIRVAQAWAGAAWGSIFIPRIGSEVVVSFLDGNPDQPLIVGAVYNATKTVPYTLPGDMTKSTVKSQSSPNGAGKSNELRFEDKAGSEEIYIHAQKDMTVDVLNNATTTITANDSATVNGTQTVTVKGNRTFAVSEGNETHTVKEGNETHEVTLGTRAVTVGGNETRTNKSNFTQTVSGDFTQKVTGDYALTVSGKMTVTVTGGLTIKAGDVTLQTTAGAIAVTAAQGLTLKAGTNLAATAGVGLTANGATISITGSSEVNVQGAIANFKADGMGEVSAGGILTVKGSLVQIN